MTELTADWPEHLRQDFRQICLMALMHRPVAWRSRRTDYFESEDLNLVLQRSTLDLRFRRGAVRGWVESLIEGYELGALTDCSVPVLTDALASLESTDSADLLVPLFWAPGPMMDLSIECGGVGTAPLTRREAADVMAKGLFFRTMHMAYKAGLVPVPIRDGKSATSIWKEVGWCVTATDMHYLRSHRAIAGLRKPLDSPWSRRCLFAWLRANLRQAGCSRHAAKVVLLEQRERVMAIIAKTSYLHKRFNDLDSVLGVAVGDIYNPVLNPLLMFHSYVRRAAWVMRDEPRAIAPSAPVLLPEFLKVCEYWTDCLEGLSRAVDCVDVENGPLSKTEAGSVLSVLARFGASWPVLARVNVPLEGTLRVTVSQRVPIPAKSMLDLSEGSLARATSLLLAFGKAGPFTATEAARWTADLLGRATGARPLARSLVGMIGYPLALNDASSYHVEVACSGGGAALVRKSAFVVIPRKDFGSAKARRWFTRRGWSSIVGSRRLDVRDVFGRVTDEGATRQHFYTTRIAPTWMTTRACGRSSGIHVLGSQPMLLLRYRMSGPWAYALGLAAATLLLLSFEALRLSMLEAAGWNDFPGAVSFRSFVAIAAPIFVAIALLIAVDHRESRLLVSRVGILSWAVLVAYAVFGTAVLGWVSVFAPKMLWQWQVDGVSDPGSWGRAWIQLSHMAKVFANLLEHWVTEHGLSALLLVFKGIGLLLLGYGAIWAFGIVAEWCEVRWGEWKHVRSQDGGMGD